jgi:hypothetical protein
MGLNENQIRMSFELKLQLTGTTKTVLLWNVILKKVRRICRIILFRLLSAIGCQETMTTLRSNSDERHDKDKKYPHNTQIFFYRLDQENMLERNCKPGWYEVTTLIEAVEARQFHIRHASSNRRICTVLSKSYGIISIALNCKSSFR